MTLSGSINCFVRTAFVRVRRSLLITLAFALSFVGLNNSTFAQPIVVPCNTIISDTDTTYDGQDIIVRGCTLIVNGSHSFNSLTLEFLGTGGFVSHSQGFFNVMTAGASLSVTGNVVVNTNCAISLDGKGQTAGTGPGAGVAGTFYAGGGGYGGAGGYGAQPLATGGFSYGSVFQPVDLGSGGASDPDQGSLGGTGGGALRLTVGGTLTVNGSITARGNNYNGNDSGGGSGGSLWIGADAIAGTGTIQANGGDMTNSNNGGGGGGGGRIAVYYNTLSLPVANITAIGGADASSQGRGGGAGTVYLKQGSARGTIHIDNGLRAVAEITGFPGVTTLDADIIVRNNGLIGPSRGETGMHLTVLGNLTVANNGFVSANNRGNLTDTGPGAGVAGTFYAGGGGYGGAGGYGAQPLATGGFSYGSIFQPVDLGSGGASDPDQGSLGGTGGGALRLTVVGTLTVNGSITARGNNYNGNDSGGGSGGSLWIGADAIAGTGTIQANGGDMTNSNNGGGGGGGGRIAVYYNTLSLPVANITAIGGADASSQGRGGGAGTVYLKQGSARGTIYIDNGLRAVAEITGFPGVTTLDADIIVRNNGLIGPSRGETGMHLTVLGNLTVANNGFVSANNRGNLTDTGPGAGVAGTFYAGGGGYGGAGGYGAQPLATGGFSYGSIFQPVDLGSGGASDPDQGSLGGTGGGALRLTVVGTLTVNGSITARGNNYNGNDSGGGSGGSLWIGADAIAGTGTIQANGGDMTNSNNGGGGGGGGRIAVYYNTLSLPVANITAIGGADASSQGRGGGAGTVYLKQGSARGTIYIDNGLRAVAEITGFPGVTTLDADIIVRNNGLIGPSRGETGMHLTVLGNLTVQPTGLISATSRGSVSDSGLGTGMSGRFYGGGAGYGGAGGDGNGGDGFAFGGPAYDSDNAGSPTALGSGGASDPDQGNLGGTGGGAIRLTVGGTFDVRGGISANGSGGTGNQGGGGSGGSIWITASTLSGFGTISANGGAGGGGLGGGGGGGRIAIYTCTTTLPMANITAAAGSGGSGSQMGSIIPGSNVITIVGQPQSVAACPAAAASFNVSISGAASSYQWRRNGAGIAGATSPTYTIPSVSTADAGMYDCVVGGLCGTATSAMATLTVNAATLITMQPQPTSACVGASAGLIVSATGTGTLAYQWQKNGVDVTGANAASFTIPSVTASSAGSYTCVVSGTCGTALSNTAVFTVLQPPLITQSPSAAIACAGGPASFFVVATGAPPLGYQWRKDGVDIAGATTATLMIANSTTASVGLYDCVVQNSCGSAASDQAALVLCPADFNCSGAVTVQDIFDFLAAYFAADPRADFNMSGTISVQDIFDFLAAYFAGC